MWIIGLTPGLFFLFKTLLFKNVFYRQIKVSPTYFTHLNLSLGKVRTGNEIRPSNKKGNFTNTIGKRNRTKLHLEKS